MQRYPWLKSLNYQPKIESSQQKALKRIKLFYLKGAAVFDHKTSITIRVYRLVDKDLDFFRSLEGMYTDIEIKRSDKGLIVIMNF